MRFEFERNAEWEQSVLLSADRHWDNPDSDQALQKRHLDQAVEMGAPVADFGDFFCVMQGKYDKRSNKSKVREEHQVTHYLDAVVDTAVDWFAPYAGQFVCIGEGNHECVDEETQVLTRDGWKDIANVSRDDHVCGMHPITKEPHYAEPLKVHCYDYSGDMLHFKNRSVDMKITPNHRVAYLAQNSEKLEYREASEILESPNTAFSVPTCGVITQESQCSLSDDEIRLAAWILTDGSLTGKTACIYQSKPEMVERIGGLLTRLNLEYSRRVQHKKVREIAGVALKSDPLPQYIFRILEKSRDIVPKVVPEGKGRMPSWVFKLDKRQFDVFLEELILGDGARHKSSKTSMMMFGMKFFLEDLQRACAVYGYRANLSNRHRRNGTGYWCLNITPNAKITVRSRGCERVPHHGKVYCLTTPSGNFFARRNGKVFVTGNSAIKNRHETDLIERLCGGLSQKTGHKVYNGKYGGYILWSFRSGEYKQTFRQYYYHGSGGGGPVTLGVIQSNRRAASIEADIYTTGHIHESWMVERQRLYVSQAGKVKHRPEWHLCLPTYKDEYKKGAGGWHVETGKPPKPVGAHWMTFRWDRHREAVYPEFTRAR